MSNPYSNIIPTAETDGIAYCTNVPITFNEADLSDGLSGPTPIPVEYGQVISAVGVATVGGYVVGNNTYIIMQTDMGDNNWIDVAWVVLNLSQGSQTFLLRSTGVAGQPSAATLPPYRAPGSSPGTGAAVGQNPIGCLGRARFVGKSSFNGGSSSTPGVSNVVAVSIRYKLYTPR